MRIDLDPACIICRECSLTHILQHTEKGSNSVVLLGVIPK